MADLMTEEEQIIAIKTWWKKYGWYVIGGITAGLILYFGYSTWQTHNFNARADASLNYETIVDNLAMGKVQEADKQIVNDANAQLPMPYVQLEQWLLSEVELKQNNYDKALINLQQALVLSEDPFTRELSSTRLARIYIAQGKSQEALDMLALKNDAQASKNPEVYLARGDAYAALQDIENARSAYEQAWQLFPTYSPARELIAMILAELPERISAGAQ